MPKISFLIPCYFNEGNIPVTTKALIEHEKLYPPETTFEYVLVDDGSQDETWKEILKFKAQYPEKVKAVKLASNVGSHNALLCAMTFATGDCNVILAADLQDPPELIPKMYHHWLNGIKFVIAFRTDREESFGQKLFSNTYHFLFRKLALTNIPKNGFDMTFFDKQLRESVVKMEEKNTHIVYLLAWLGYEYVAIPYVRRKREIGVSRWTLQKKIKLFVDSFVSFSFFPIRAISAMGFILGFLAIIYGIIILVAKLTGNLSDVQGWSSLMIVILAVSSFQMIGLGIIGEYVWRTLDATRKRPNFIVEKSV
jgi:dolichol-phosphate mannosyltransferase